MRDLWVISGFCGANSMRTWCSHYEFLTPALMTCYHHTDNTSPTTHLFQIYNMPGRVGDRWSHSINAVVVRDNCVWVMVVGGFRASRQYPGIILLELSEWHNVTTSSGCFFLTTTNHVLLIVLFSSDACLSGEHSICSPASELNTKGYWEVTDIREDERIYSGYTERFCQTFPAQVCGVFNYDILSERSWYDWTCLQCPQKRCVHICTRCINRSVMETGNVVL